MPYKSTALQSFNCSQVKELEMVMSQWEMFESQVKALPSPMSSYQGPSVSIIHPSDFSILLLRQTCYILILISLVGHLSISESAKFSVLLLQQYDSVIWPHSSFESHLFVNRKNTFMAKPITMTQFSRYQSHQ